MAMGDDAVSLSPGYRIGLTHSKRWKCRQINTKKKEVNTEQWG